MLDHSIENGQQLVHAGGQCDLFHLPRRQEPLVESFDDRVVSGCHQGGHVQDSAHSGPATPYPSLATQQPAVPVEGGEPYQPSDLLVPHSPQFGEFGHEGNRNHGADAFDTLEQVVFGPPEGTVLDGIAQTLISIIQFLFPQRDSEVVSNVARPSPRVLPAPAGFQWRRW